MRSATRSNQQGRTGQWLSTVAAAVIAVVGSVAPTSQAQASIVYSGATNIAVPATLNGIYLNVVTGVSGAAGADPNWDINVFGAGSVSFWANNSASPNSGVVDGLGSFPSRTDNLAVGTLVGSGQTYGRDDFTNETTGSTAFLVNSSINYIGFRILNEVTGQYDFGWLQMQFGPTFNNSNRFILGWAYEDTGAAIRVGDTGEVAGVPEPGSLALLAAAWMAGAAVRSRRRTAA